MRKILKKEIFGLLLLLFGLLSFISIIGYDVSEQPSGLEQNEIIDKNLLRYMSIKVKKFDLKTNYFSNSETTKKESYKK